MEDGGVIDCLNAGRGEERDSARLSALRLCLSLIMYSYICTLLNRVGLHIEIGRHIEESYSVSNSKQ